MSLLSDQIGKAQQRSEGLGLERLSADLDKVRGMLDVAEDERCARRDFLTRSEGDSSQAEVALERL